MNDTENCIHIWKKTGLWDGKKNPTDVGKTTGGPIIVCEKCGEEKYASWEEFRSMSRDEIENPINDSENEN